MISVNLIEIWPIYSFNSRLITCRHLKRLLKEVVQELNEPVFGFDIQGVRFHVGLEGSFGELYTNPRHLSSRLLSHMVCLDGIVTSCSLVRPKLQECPLLDSMKTFLVKEYWDATMLNGMQLLGQLPIPLKVTINKTHKWIRIITISRLSNDFDSRNARKAPAGQLPPFNWCRCRWWFSWPCKTGWSRSNCRCLQESCHRFQWPSPSTFRAVLVANNVRQLNRDAVAPQLSAADVQQIRSLSRRSDIFDLISRSWPRPFTDTNTSRRRLL